MLDRIVTQMHEASEAGETGLRFKTRLDQLGVPATEHVTLRKTYETYDALRKAGRNQHLGLRRAQPVAPGRAVGRGANGRDPWQPALAVLPLHVACPEEAVQGRLEGAGRLGRE